MDQAEFLDMASLSRNLSCNAAAGEVRNNSNSLVDCLADTRNKRCPIVCDMKMLNLFCFNVEKRIQSLRELGTLEWICHLRTTHLHTFH